MVGIRKNRAVQNIEAVHLRLIPKFGNERYPAFMEGALMEGSLYMIIDYSLFSRTEIITDMVSHWV